MALMSEAFHRRRFTDHAPLPGPVNPLFLCGHDAANCDCLEEGTLLHGNHDIESSSWWNGAARNENATFTAFFLLGAIGLGLAVHAKHESNPTHFTTDSLTAVSATRD
jgi:hypothetical protein